ncbi:MAG TPA: PIN domain-containing protein [Acidimicrobiales bacterium]|jgi:predicted nucleic acid-binding protein
MTVLLDAFAVIAYFRDEPAASEVEALLRTRDVELTAVNAAEVVDRLARHGDLDPMDLVGELALLGVTIRPVDAPVGLLAGRLRAWHYHRDERPVSLADCCAAAAALAGQMPLATADGPLARLVEVERGEVIRLRESDQ